MKKYILITLFALGLHTSAQITFEHAYDSSSTIQGNGNPKISQLMIVQFEISGEKYIKVNSIGKTISIYKMDHSLIKTINCSNLPVDPINPQSFMDILYLSEQLFDIDSKIEFMYVTKINNNGWGSYFTGIYNEDGTLIFSDTAAPVIKSNIHLQQYPIYNTTYGTKMILSYTTGGSKVFSLSGTLSAVIAETNRQLIQAQSGQLSNLYPNPSNGAVTLQYELPKDEQTGELVLYNMQGAEVKRYKVDNTFKDLLLDNSQLQAGTYFYQLQTGKGAVGTKKMVVVK